MYLFISLAGIVEGVFGKFIEQKKRDRE